MLFLVSTHPAVPTGDILKRCRHVLYVPAHDACPLSTRAAYGLLTLAIVFLVAGLLACVLLPCCYACMGKSRQQRLAER